MEEDLRLIGDGDGIEGCVVAASSKQSDKVIVGDENISLQDSFQKFREKKIKERHILKMCNGGLGNSKGRSEESKQKLREKFISKAKEYLGVPYAEKYKAEGVPTAPLYLDCCGLVRQVLVDMQEELGFLMGRWNQAYQIDTLPIVLKKEELKPGDLIFYEGIYNNPNARPQKHNMVHVEIYLGGESGDATIGARFQRGFVNIFPSYQFKSTTWELVQYHYRSIDTWLDGECKSHCCEHPWITETWKAALASGKRSIFHENDADCNAGGDEDEEGGGDGEDMFEENQSNAPNNKNVGNNNNDNNNDSNNDSNNNTSSNADEGNVEEELSSTTTKSDVVFVAGQSSTIASINNSSPSQLFLGVGGSSMTLASKEAQIIEQKLLRKLKTTSPLKGQTAQPLKVDDAKSSSSNALSGGAHIAASKPKRTTGVRASMNVLSSCNTSNSSSSSNLSSGCGDSENEHGGDDEKVEGLVTDVSEISQPSQLSRKIAGKPKELLSDKLNTMKKSDVSPAKRISQSRRDLSASLDSLPISSLKTVKEDSSKEATSANSNSVAMAAAAAKKNPVPNTYYVGKSNGWKLVKDALDKRGWQQLPFEYQFSSRFNLKWVERRSQIDYRSHQPGQLVSHIPNNDCITSKTGIYSTLKEYFSNLTSGGNAAKVVDSKSIPWVPETYRLDVPADVTAFLKSEEQYAAAKASKEELSLWIYKPACFNRGRGIRVIEGKETIDEILNGVDTGDAETTVPPAKGIMQRYMTDPLLIGPEGYKFDIRVYFLIARNFPTTLAFYHPGYCRLTLKPFIMTKESLDDPTVHLTNAAIQKKDSLYKENKEKQIQSPGALADTLDACGLHSNAEFMRNGLDHEIKLCLSDIAVASNSKLLKKHGYFDLLGCDFMVTTSNKLVLIEINSNPALSLDNSTLEQLLPGVVDATIEIVLQSQGPDRPSRRKDDKEMLSSLPGKFELIYDEAAGFKYSA